MKKIGIVILALITCIACAKKASNASEPGNTSKGTVTESKPGAESTGEKDLSGTWVVTEGGRTWELVITPTGKNTWTTTPTLISNSQKDGLIDYGPPGSKGDTLIIVSDEPGRFRVRYAKAENFHGADFWNGTGTYDDNSFNFGGYYLGRRKI
jgi:hypothetical protein